jgi:hypothetical protein
MADDGRRKGDAIRPASLRDRRPHHISTISSREYGSSSRSAPDVLRDPVQMVIEPEGPATPDVDHVVGAVERRKPQSRIGILASVIGTYAP